MTQSRLATDRIGNTRIAGTFSAIGKSKKSMVLFQLRIRASTGCVTVGVFKRRVR